MRRRNSDSDGWPSAALGILGDVGQAVAMGFLALAAVAAACAGGIVLLAALTRCLR